MVSLPLVMLYNSIEIMYGRVNTSFDVAVMYCVMSVEKFKLPLSWVSIGKNRLKSMVRKN